MVYVYKDIISGAEMVDDNMELVEDFNGHILKVVSQKIVDEDDADEKMVVDVVKNFRYIKLEAFSQKQFLLFMKRYLKAIKANLEEQKKEPEYIKSFMSNAGAYCKFIKSKFGDAEFYLNEKEDNPDGALGMALWVNESDVTATFYFFKDGLNKIKF